MSSGETRVRANHAAFAAAPFRRCFSRYGGEHKVKTFSCVDQHLYMAFA